MEQYGTMEVTNHTTGLCHCMTVIVKSSYIIRQKEVRGRKGQWKEEGKGSQWNRTGSVFHCTGTLLHVYVNSFTGF
jgi:hypothetical protein